MRLFLKDQLSGSDFMKEYKIRTYEEAIAVIEEIGILPLAPLLPDYPSLNSITPADSWHSDTEFDPWAWRTRFSVDGVAAYGKFLKKKSVLISRDWFPHVRAILGSNDSIKQRYDSGLVSREALHLYGIIEEEPGIDTRLLRTKAGMKEKEKKKAFDAALIELQGTLDIAVSGIKEKQDEQGEKNGWSSTSFETVSYWLEKNNLEQTLLDVGVAKQELRDHFAKIGCSDEALKRIEKIFLMEKVF
jgi:hypothetical protein